MTVHITMATKRALLSALRASLESEVARTTESQRATQHGATHSENKQESDKDTRAIEAGYLARGLSMRVEALAGDLARLEALTLRSFDEDEAAAIGAWVVLDDGAPGGGAPPCHYFLAPVGGGVKLAVDGHTVSVVTPRSPVGQALVGKAEGDEVRVATPAGGRTAEVVGVY